MGKRARIVICGMGVFLFILSLGGRCAAQESLTRWNLGEVPSKTVWHGDFCAFLVQWEGHPACVIQVRADPAPAGPIHLMPLTGELAGWWMFSYVPCTNAPCGADRFPFTVTLTGRDGEEIINQSFELTPLAPLVPEQVVFDPANHTQSDLVEVDDPDPQVTTAAGKLWMNHQQVYPRTVLIRRQTIEIEQGNPNDYYVMFDGARDIEMMEMIAEKVIIRSPLHLPQTNVIIRAAELVMEGDGAIITTPLKNTVIPAGSTGPGDPGDNGGNGLPAGDVTLEVSSFVVSGPGLRFDLRGGPGQDAGAGKDGNNGRSVYPYYDSFSFTDSWVTYTWTAPAGEYIIYWEAWLWGTIKTFERPGPNEAAADYHPTSGTDAAPSGKPGKGGRAGTLRTTVDTAAAYANVSPGTPGLTPTQRMGYPTSYYRGGTAGTPTKWLKMRNNYWWPTLPGTIWATSSGTTTAGVNGAVVQPDPPSQGDYGSCLTEGNSFAWIDPILMDLLFGRAKDLYLNGRLDEAQARMEELSATLETYMADAAWASAPADSQRDLRKMYDQMKTLLYQIGTNLDYYGNPAGWVPMLSFEVNTTLFDNEIDRAIDMLYLGHWIGKTSATQTQRRNALVELHGQLQQEIDESVDAYDAAMENIGTLQIRAAEVRHKMEQQVENLRVLEVQLESQADANTQTPWWKTGLKMAAVVCKIIPLVQPAAGYLGTGMEMVVGFDPKQPYDTVLQGTQLVDKIISTQLETVATGVGAAAKAATGDVGDAAKFIVDSLGVSKTGLTDYVKGMKAAVEGIHAPADKIKAELERLKALSPEFKAQAEKIEALHAQQGELARDTAQTMLRLTSLADLITEDLLAMDTLREELASQPVLDPRAAMYVAALNRRAIERLQKYHYYMAKAYEYRLLKPYTQALNLDDLMDELANSAIPGPEGNVIPPAQFATLKGIYRDAIRTVAEEIFTMYNNNPPELSAPVRFNLTPEEIAAINAGQKVRLNLMDLGIFPSEDENVRIVNFKVYQIATQAVGGPYEQNAYVDLRIEHSGLSKLMAAGQTYLFRHYNRQTTNPITWGARYFPVDNDVNPIAPSAAAASLLKSLLSSTAGSDMMLYSRPSVWADLEFSLSVRNNAGKDIDLSTLRLELQYDFVRRNPQLRLCDIQLQVATAEPPDGTPETKDTFMPYFVLGKADKNQRSDARGWVHRIYPVNSLGLVDIRAQRKYGDWKFNKWTNQYGQDLSGGPWLDPLLKAVPDMDKTFAAQYVPLDVLPADLNSDCVVDMADLATMAVAWMNIFPMISLNEEDAMQPIGMAELVMLSEQYGMRCEDVMQGTTPLKAVVEPADPRQIEYCE